MKKKGLLLVANWDSDVGYAWWLMESFWIALDKAYRNSHHSIIAYPVISKVPEKILQSNIELHEVNFTKKDIYHVFKQCLFILKFNIRCIYFSDQSFQHWRYLLFRLFGVRVIVVHDHTPGLRTEPNGFKKILKSMLIRLPFVTCNAVIAVSDFIKNRAVRVACFPESRVFVARNGIPFKTVSDIVDIRKEINLDKKTILMVTTGRVQAYKGIFFALECMRQLVHEKNYTHLHWVFCGDGPDFSLMLCKIKEYKLEKYISLLGRRNDVLNILPVCDIAFHPSKGEVGYSLSILEYMQAGLPVVVSNNPSVCGATEDKKTGVIYEEGSVDSACQAITSLIDAPVKIDEYGNNAITASKLFSLDATHTQLVDSMRVIDSDLEQ